MKIFKIVYFISLLQICFNSAKAQEAWSVLASPIKLNVDTTELLLSDYFPFSTSVDSIITPSGITAFKSGSNKIVLIGGLNTAVASITFIVDKVKYDVPVFASDKENVQLNIQLANPVSDLKIKGSFSNWALITKDIEAIGPVPSRVWVINLKALNKGRHEYKLVGDGIELDPINSEIVPNGIGGTNAVLTIGNKNSLKATLSTLNFDANKININAENIDGYFAFWNHQKINYSLKSTGKINLQIPAAASKIKRSYIRVYAWSANNRSNDVLIPLEYGKVISSSSLLDRSDLHTQIMYFIMVDRFMNGDKMNDTKALEGVHPKANFLGGDLNGIQAKIEEGYFKNLGFNTIWLSPISKNADGAWGLWEKGLKTKFSAYHGYWPTSYSLVDPRFGSNAGFKNLIDIAHENECNIVLDFVAHHIHTDHPLYKQHPDWVTTLYLPDGSLNTERWDDHRLTTWFDVFLPTLDFQKEIVNKTISDSVMYWVKNFKIDGFRHDASKHVPEVFWRTLTQKIRQEKRNTNEHFFQIGETYGSHELIASYVNSGQMDAQFNFNLYDAAITAFAFDARDDKKDFDALKNAIRESEYYYGTHHLMGNISGNQDKPRFISIAEGQVIIDEDTKLAGWTRTIEHSGSIGFQRLAQLHALNFSITGIPIVYYGDEIGMPGANDPDNRRMMRFQDLNSNELELKEIVQQLADIRSQNLEFLYGDLSILDCTEGFFAIERNYFGKKSIIVFSKEAGLVSIKSKDTRTPKAYFNHKVNMSNEDIKLEMSNNDFEIIRYE